jgi:hypothetical protein
MAESTVPIPKSDPEPEPEAEQPEDSSDSPMNEDSNIFKLFGTVSEDYLLVANSDVVGKIARASSSIVGPVLV